MTAIKTKARNRMIDINDDMRCALSVTEPRIGKLIKNKQLQVSH